MIEHAKPIVIKRYHKFVAETCRLQDQFTKCPSTRTEISRKNHYCFFRTERGSRGVVGNYLVLVDAYVVILPLAMDMEVTHKTQSPLG